MNWDHIKAVMFGGSKKVATVGDQRVLTNGHIMFLVEPGSPLIGTANEYPKAAELWQAASLPAEPQPIGALYTERGYYYRAVGAKFISEHYFRCFNGPGVTWTETATHELVHLNGVLIAVVMPCGGRGFKVVEVPEVDDSTVFSPYASDENDWYLVNEATLRAHIGAVEDERNAAESKRDDAEATIEECDAEIASLQLRLTRLAAGVK